MKSEKLKKCAKILPKIDEKQRSKKEGVPGPNFIDFGSILGPFWGQEGSKSSPRRGSIFEVKNGREKIDQKSEKNRSGELRTSLAGAIRCPFGPCGAGGKQQN